MSRAPSFLGALAAAAIAAGSLLASAGCTTAAFCFDNCDDEPLGTSSTTNTYDDAGVIGGSGGECLACGGGGGGTGGCEPTGDEVCDQVDNDCNGKVDDLPGLDLESPQTCGVCSNDCTTQLLNCTTEGVTCVPSKEPGVSPGTCVCEACSDDWHDLDGDGKACEYYCVKAADDDTVCDHHDDDCDGVDDEDVDLCSSVTDCGKCGGGCVVLHGSAACVHEGGGACDPSNTHCAIAACDCKPGDCFWDLDNSYATGCEYACEPTNGGVEICGDGLDNDCDGKLDGADDLSLDPQIGKTCFGDPDGLCATKDHAGKTACVGLKVECVGPDVLHQKDQLEVCNGVDDDCDGEVDNGPTDAGKPCGLSAVFPCTLGVETCQNGKLVCIGQVDPKVETCNGVDDDCDGTIDDGTVDSGAECGESGAAPCKKGKITCLGGSLQCVGAVDPQPEICNGKDDDCDGKVDDAPEGAGESCGQSGQFPCSFGTLQCQGGKLACVGAVDPKAETCNGVDDDCDGKVDDAPEGAGESCGASSKFPCKLGKLVCQGGALVCSGSVDPQLETCNGKDDDCDGVIDDNPSGVGASCGVSGKAPCKLGTLKCIGGALQCSGAVDPQPETCNGKDDDCDGSIDDSPVGVGGACGQSGTAPCKLGTLQCVLGSLSCVGAVDPKGETCNGKDDDCNGKVDDNPGDVGASCGVSNAFPCAFGSKQCVGGALQCVGAVNPGVESCNGQDDDCDGVIDKAGGQTPPDAVGDCNVPPPPPAGATSPCKKGTKSCVGGVVTCQGAVGPTSPTDECGEDSNCDGLLTGQPDTKTDPQNCGACGKSCYAGAVHSQWACSAGACQFTGCDPGYYDLDGDKKCEYACVFVQPQETCNGVDDNCNGQIDENVQAPSPVQVCGVSPSATRSECTTQVTVSCQNGSWKCAFPAGVCSPSCAGATEICDGLDNDCDGALNENVANYNKPCASDDGLPPPGHGACRTFGAYVCNGPNATKCGATKGNCNGLPGGCAETCDGVDNDCDGSVDEPFSAKGGNATYFVKPAVTKIAASVWIHTYEASRPSATGSTAGVGNGYWCTGGGCVGVPPAPAGETLDRTAACSVPAKIPWFNVTPIEVEQTCQAMGGKICATADWQTGCKATAACNWGYNPRGGACLSGFTGTKFCNLGPSFDFDPAAGGDQDGLLPTASAQLGNCWADWSGLLGNPASAEKLYDVTGNLREITKSAANVYPAMGGAFDTADPGGATCSFSFYSVDASFKLFDLGFRCCFTADPAL